MIEFVLFLLFFIAFAWLVRGFISNNLTYNHRMELIGNIRIAYAGTEEYWEVSIECDAVSYDQHYNEVFWGRDPWKLYSNRIQELMK